MALWYNCGKGLVKATFACSDLKLDAYLYYPSPSLSDIGDLDIHVQGAMSFVVNTAYPRIRPNVWIGSDDPRGYDIRLLFEPFMKIVRGGYQSQKSNGIEIQDYPQMFFADCRGEIKNPVDMLLQNRSHDAVFVWNKSAFFLALHVIVWMGARQINLVGCDTLTLEEIRILRSLSSRLERRHVKIKSCTKDSPINEFLEYRPLKLALKFSRKRVPSKFLPVTTRELEECKWASHVTSPAGVMVGCASIHEDLIPWWIKNYKRYNSYPIAFADFGISHSMKEFCSAFGEVIDCSEIEQEGWFRKPFAILKAPFQKIIWCDTDIEIRGDLKPLWAYSDGGKIGVGHDSFQDYRENEAQIFRARLDKDMKIWDTGLISVEHGSSIVEQWSELIVRAERDDYQGDHQVLSIFLGKNLELVNPIPKTMHRLKVDPAADAVDNSHLLSMHWTGPSGKTHIRDLIKNV